MEQGAQAHEGGHLLVGLALPLLAVLGGEHRGELPVRLEVGHGADGLAPGGLRPVGVAQGVGHAAEAKLLQGPVLQGLHGLPLAFSAASRFPAPKVSTGVGGGTQATVAASAAAVSQGRSGAIF